MLKLCDNLSPPITLYYKTGDRHSSSFSGLLTIISYLTIIGLSVVFSLDFILKINPTSFFIINIFQIQDFFLSIQQEFFILLPQEKNIIFHMMKGHFQFMVFMKMQI